MPLIRRKGRGRSRRSTIRYPRGGEEFGRVLAFSDGLFAIAMTLLVVGITVPKSAATGSLTTSSSAG